MSDNELEGLIEDDNEFEVDRVILHEFRDDGLYYYVSWKGYDDSENTWEPEDNLDTAKHIVDEYWEANKDLVKTEDVPPKAKDKKKGKTPAKRGRKKATTPEAPVKKASSPDGSSFEDDEVDELEEDEEEEDDDASTRPRRAGNTTSKNSQQQLRRARKSSTRGDSSDSDDNAQVVRASKRSRNQWATERRMCRIDNKLVEVEVIIDDNYPNQSGSWDGLVKRILSVLEEDDEGQYYAVVEWNNGDHSLHGNLLLRKKCPLKLIDFYEDHIMFRKDE